MNKTEQKKVDIPDADVAGVKAKIEHYYSLMQMDAPWKSTGKARKKAMDKEKKDFNDRYRSQQISSWCSEFYDLSSALRQSIQDIFAIGDTPNTDLVDTILNDADDSQGFINALKAYVQRGIDLDYSDYMQAQQVSNPYGGSPYDGYMSGRGPLQGKSGATFSAANKNTIQGHIDALHGVADQQTEQTKGMAKAIHSVADDLAVMLQGSEPAYSTDPGDAGDRQEGKSTSQRTAVRGDTHQTHSSKQTDTVTDADLDAFYADLQRLKPTTVSS